MLENHNIMYMCVYVGLYVCVNVYANHRCCISVSLITISFIKNKAS